MYISLWMLGYDCDDVFYHLPRRSTPEFMSTKYHTKLIFLNWYIGYTSVWFADVLD